MFCLGKLGVILYPRSEATYRLLHLSVSCFEARAYFKKVVLVSTITSLSSFPFPLPSKLTSWFSLWTILAFIILLSSFVRLWSKEALVEAAALLTLPCTGDLDVDSLSDVFGGDGGLDNCRLHPCRY